MAGNSCLWCSDPTKRFIYAAELNGHLCERCYQRHRGLLKLVKHDLPPAGEVLYDERGYPICHICGYAYRKVLSHAFLIHGVFADDYKRRFGLYHTKGICCEETRLILSGSVKRNFRLVVADNLLKNGRNTRFIDGHPGRPAEKVSLQLHLALSQRNKKGAGKKAAGA